MFPSHICLITVSKTNLSLILCSVGSSIPFVLAKTAEQLPKGFQLLLQPAVSFLPLSQQDDQFQSINYGTSVCLTACPYQSRTRLALDQALRQRHKPWNMFSIGSGKGSRSRSRSSSRSWGWGSMIARSEQSLHK